MDFIREVFNTLKYLILFAINSVIVIYLFDHFFPTDENLVLALDPMTIMALGQVGVSLYQGYKSKQQTERGEQDLIDAEKAQANAIAAMRAVEIQNKLEALQVPTLGAEVQERAITRGLAGTLDMLGQTDAATALGGVTRAQTQADASSAQIAANLDMLEAQRDRTVLTEDQRIELEKKQRELDIQNMILGGAGDTAADSRRLQQMGELGQVQALGGIVTGLAAASPAYLGQTGGGMDMAAQTQMATPRAAQAIDVQSTQPSLRMPGTVSPIPPAGVSTTNLTGIPMQTQLAVSGLQGYNTNITPGGMVGGIYNPYANYNAVSSLPVIPYTSNY